MWKYGVHPFLWTVRLDQEVEKVAARAKQLGFDSIDFPLNFPEWIDIPRARRAFQQEGLECTVVAGLSRQENLVDPDPAVRRRGVERLKEMIDIAHQLGAPVLSGVLYCAWGYIPGRGRTADEWRWSVEGLQQAADHARQAGVTLGLEPVNRFETYFLNTTEDGLKLLADVGKPNVKLLLDTFHINIEERSYVEPFRMAAGKLAHVHACENDRGTPGSGHVDWAGVMRVLKATGYQGHIVIESFVPETPAIARETAIWRKIAPSGDFIAGEGLRYLKALEQVVLAEPA
ncbi:MAG: sugar phosphate isomerase/epimerase [Limnochordaceae bacterium]|nr:sugar phosphate isomerase/epimerase [Limnochordaceae bacterium]